MSPKPKRAGQIEEKNHPEEEKWKELGRINVKRWLDARREAGSKILIRDIAKASGEKEGDISRFLSNKGPKSSHDRYQNLARGIAKVENMSEVERINLEIDFTLHSGLLPAELLQLSPKAQERAIKVITALVSMLAEQLPRHNDSEHDAADIQAKFDEILSYFEKSVLGWNTIFRFVEQRKLVDEWTEIEELWQPIEKMWSTLSDQQRAYAVIERASTLATRGLTADALVMMKEALARFPMEPEPEPALKFLYRRMYQGLGSVYREAGNLDSACAAYRAARQYADTALDTLTLYRQEVNAYLRVVEVPPPTYISLLQNAITPATVTTVAMHNGSQFELSKPLPASVRISIHQTLAWYFRNRGDMSAKDAVSHSDEALRLAKENWLPRDIAISEQYAAETHLRAGDLTEAAQLAHLAHEIFSQSASAFVRRGWARTLEGRALGYQALDAGGDVSLMERAVNALADADDIFSLMGTSQRRAQALNDLGKFMAHYAILSTLGATDRMKLYKKARREVERAQSILRALDTYKKHDTWAKDVNLFIVDYLAEISSYRASPIEYSQSNEANNLLQSLKGYLEKLRSQTKGAEVGSRQMASGHRSRVQVMILGLNIIVVTLKIDIRSDRLAFLKEQLDTNKQAHEMAKSHDRLAVDECRQLLSYAVDSIRTNPKVDMNIGIVLDDLINEWPRPSTHRSST
jgi:tetratricopeptide (TPR) repeat protein